MLFRQVQVIKSRATACFATVVVVIIVVVVIVVVVATNQLLSVYQFIFIVISIIIDSQIDNQIQKRDSHCIHTHYL